MTEHTFIDPISHETCTTAYRAANLEDPPS